jgi:hypothetical protein
MMMVGFVAATRYAAAIGLTAVVLAISAPAYARSGAVHIKVIKAGFIVGGSGGSGTLTFNKRTYRLKVGGITLGTVGVAEADLIGRANHLRRAADIVGTYQTIGAGVAVVGGATVVRLQNGNDVVLELRGAQEGLEATLGLGGLTIGFP